MAKTKTLDEKLFDIAVVNDNVKNIKIQKQIVSNITNTEGMVEIALRANGERSKVFIPANLITDYLTTLETTKQAELEASKTSL